MAVREVKSKSISADYRNVVKCYVLGYAFIVKHLFARPFVNARSARATAAKLGRGVSHLGIVRPFDRDQTVGFFDDLCGFDSYIPS